MEMRESIVTIGLGFSLMVFALLQGVDFSVCVKHMTETIAFFGAFVAWTGLWKYEIERRDERIRKLEARLLRRAEVRDR